MVITPAHLPSWRRLMLLLICLLAIPAQAAPPKAQLLPGENEGSWLLIIEADGERRSDELNLTPLLRQFAVGRVSISRVITQITSLTRWQIPLHRVASDASQVPALTLGTEQTPSLPLTSGHQPDSLTVPLPSPIELIANVLHQGPLYPGQPFIYELSLWLPANLEAPNLGEPVGEGFNIRRLGNDQWDSPSSPGMPGRLTRKWLLQAKEAGLHPIESPRFQGRLPQSYGGSEALSARAATRLIKVDKAPVEPVASSLVLTEQFTPATGARTGEPVIRTLTLVMEGGDGNRLTLPPSTPLPPGLTMRPDGEQQQERFLAKGALRTERQWRQALIAQAPGRYALPALELPWFNTQSGRIDHARLPARVLVFEATADEETPRFTSGGISLFWVLGALLLRALCKHGSRWRAFWRLQGALARQEPNSARWAALGWGALRWGEEHRHLSSLPCHQDPAIGPLLDELDRACFADPDAITTTQVRWSALAKGLCAVETFAIAYSLRKLARLHD
ncbi:hypothetical protein [Aeromonas sp. AE23HZ002T15]